MTWAAILSDLTMVMKLNYGFHQDPSISESWRMHSLQVDDMREAMEDALYEFGVDVIFTGHVHAYERTHPVYGAIQLSPVFPSASYFPQPRAPRSCVKCRPASLPSRGYHRHGLMQAAVSGILQQQA